MTSYTRHIFDSLQSAAKLAVIQDGFDLSSVNFDRWAETYHATPAQVADAFAEAMRGTAKLPEELAASVPAIQQTEDEE